MEVRLSDEELAAVVRRAHEIQALQGRLEQSRGTMEEYVSAAEEMGVPRDAMMQALNERFAFLNREIEPGLLVFARSSDGRYYAAKVLEARGDAVAVRFLNGGEGTVGRHELQEAAFAPGTDYEYQSPSYMMHVRATVVRYDRDAMTVTFNYWGTEETVPLSKVRTVKPRVGGVPAWVWTLVSALSTGAVATFVTWLVMR
jgi:hypothetical protein